MTLGRVLCRIRVHSWVVRRRPGVAPYVACHSSDKEPMLDLRPGCFMGGTEGEIFGGRAGR